MMLTPSPAPCSILSSPFPARKRREARAAAQAKERETLLSHYPFLRWLRESETWLIGQLIYHWALAVIEQRPVQWEAGRGYWSRLIGFSVTTVSKAYHRLSKAGLLTIKARGPKGWNGWQTHILRPGPALRPAILRKARQLRAERARKKRHAAKKDRLSLTPNMNKNSGVSDNLEKRRPLREDSSPSQEAAQHSPGWLTQLYHQARQAQSTA